MVYAIFLGFQISLEKSDTSLLCFCLYMIHPFSEKIEVFDNEAIFMFIIISRRSKQTFTKLTYPFDNVSFSNLSIW